MAGFKENIALYLKNLPGWRSGKKYLIIESDDWGMVRMHSKEAYNHLLSKGYPVDKCAYNRFDTIESNDDLEALIQSFNGIKDCQGNSPVITMNNVVANPDSEKIIKSNYSEYHYEPFTKTLERYSNRDQVLNLYQQGIKQGIFSLEFHGREHFNLNRWMQAIQSGNQALRDALDWGMFTVSTANRTNCRINYLDAFGRAYQNELSSEQSIIEEGVELFREIWGKNPESFIAPCYIWHPDIERFIVDMGIKYIQGHHRQKIPKAGDRLETEKKFRYTGLRSKSGLLSIVRNVFFELSENPGKDLHSSAMNEVDIAFAMGKPAVVSIHRVNFMGNIDPKNRKENLKSIETFLRAVIKKHPEVQFISSSQLGRIVSGEKV